MRDENVVQVIYTRAQKVPRTYMENNRRPGCCSCNLYNVGYDVVIDGDDGDNDGDGGDEVFVLDF